MDRIAVVALKAFDGIEGYVRRGATIWVSEFRARALEENGLISRKMNPTSQNKMAPLPQNKGNGVAAGAKSSASPAVRALPKQTATPFGTGETRGRGVA